MFEKFHFVDTIVVHASALGVEPFFVDHIETLQFICLGLVTSIFQNETGFRPLFENIIHDMLTTVNKH